MTDPHSSPGWWSSARQVVSPNADQRPHDEVSLLLIHAISLPPGQFQGAAIEALFTNQLDPRRILILPLSPTCAFRPIC